MKEGIIPSNRIFDRKFDRYGQVLQRSEPVWQPNDYQVEPLGRNDLAQPDVVVREVESAFAPLYDEVEFTTPGMREVAMVDTALFEEWIQDASGKRVLEIGPGTGRTTLPLADAVCPNGRVFAVDIATPYLDRVIEKAIAAGVPPARLKLAVADMQTVTTQQLREFIETEPLDFVTLWFGPLALMTTNPQDVLNKAADVLKNGGSLLITTNSLDGLSYRVPEKALKEGADPALPLGYQLSIFTKRSFPKGSDTPNGMILGSELILPARFYDPRMLQSMIEQAGLTVVETRGICRLTGLFPADPTDALAVKQFVRILSAIEPEAAASMQRANLDPEAVWNIAVAYDKQFARDPQKLGQYTYPAFRAIKRGGRS